MGLVPKVLTAVSGVGSNPRSGHVTLASVSGGFVFSRGSPVFVPPTDWRVSFELK